MSDKKWDENYRIAEDLYQDIGTINVRAKYIYKGYSIGNWISRQRGLERRNELKPERKQKLEALGILWDGHEIEEKKQHQEFLKMFYLLESYLQEHGNTRVPRSYIVNGINLGNWTSAIRESLRGTGRKLVTDEQKQLLYQIGFEFNWYQNDNNEKWDKNYALVTEYALSFGVDSIIESTKYKGCCIGNWIHTQRCLFNKGKLSELRIRKLSAIGINFKPSADKWDKAFSIAKKYFNEFHNLRVPDDFIFEGFHLGRWISNQRQIYNGSRKDMILTDEKIIRLESIGMEWKPNRQNNTSFLEQAFLFYCHKIYPDVVTRDTTYGIELDIFIPSKNIAIEYDGSYWHRDKLEKDNRKDQICESAGIKLIRIREKPLTQTKSAVCYFTSNKNVNDSLGELIQRVIIDQFGVRLEIDISKDCFDIVRNFEYISGRNWNLFYDEACKYYEVNGNLLVPAAYETSTGVKLGRWIQNQRSAYKGTTYGHLSPTEIQLLEKIGMVWDVRKHNWEINFLVAKDYYEKNHNLKVHRNCVYKGVKLGKWINTQRNAFNGNGKRKLSKLRIEKLESIGMEWAEKIDN